MDELTTAFYFTDQLLKVLKTLSQNLDEEGERYLIYEMINKVQEMQEDLTNLASSELANRPDNS